MDTKEIFANKNFLVGITGGIAAYKSVELVRRLIKNGGRVRVVMTEAATNFVGPATFSAITGNKVIVNLFHPSSLGVEHIEAAYWADLAIIVPATANYIAKIANGIADDLLTTITLALDCQILICPAMETRMYEHPATQENIERLKKRAVTFCLPESGPLASGKMGAGRMMEPKNILEKAITALYPKDYKGKTIVVTAGPTREAIDPVRFISNRSSGKMGFAIAKEAKRRGAQTILLCGPVQLPPPRGVKLFKVESAQEMKTQLNHLCQERVDVLFMTAAVADFRPEQLSVDKLKKEEMTSIKLTRNQDIVANLKNRPQVVVGFAAQTGDPRHRAREKLKNKKLDMIVANDVTQKGAGFEVDTNIVTVICQEKEKLLPLMSKQEVAGQLLNMVLPRLK